MGERKLKEQFNALAERLRNGQLTVEQLGELQSIKCFYTDNREGEGSAKLRAFPTGMLLLLLIFLVVGLTLSPQLQIAAVLLDFCGLQVMHLVLLQDLNTVSVNTTSAPSAEILHRPGPSAAFL